MLEKISLPSHCSEDKPHNYRCTRAAGNDGQLTHVNHTLSLFQAA